MIEHAPGMFTHGVPKAHVDAAWDAYVAHVGLAQHDSAEWGCELDALHREYMRAFGEWSR